MSKKKRKKTFKDYLDVSSRLNTNTMKLLVSTEWFQFLVMKMRGEYNIPTPDSGEDKLLQNVSGWYNKVLDNTSLLNKFRRDIAKIIEDARLPSHFDWYIESYLFTNRIIAPPVNFEIHHRIDLKTGAKEKSPSVRIHQKLTTGEEKLARTQLNQMLKSPLNEVQKSRRNIDRDIEIASKMSARGIRKDKSYSGYLSYIKKAVDRGSMSSSQLKELEKIHPDDVDMKVIKYTSQDVAKETLGLRKKHDTVRKALERLKKSQEKRFEKM